MPPINGTRPSQLVKGCEIFLLTRAKYCYEGIVQELNSNEDTLTLTNVTFWGNENQNYQYNASKDKTPDVGTKFDSIIFWISNVIKISIKNGNGKKEFGDTAVVMAAISNEQTTNHTNRKYNTGNYHKIITNSEVFNHNNKHQHIFIPTIKQNSYKVKKTQIVPYLHVSCTNQRHYVQKYFKSKNYRPFVTDTPMQSNDKNIYCYKLLKNPKIVTNHQFGEHPNYQNKYSKRFPKYTHENNVYLYVPNATNQFYSKQTKHPYPVQRYNVIKTKQRPNKQNFGFDNGIDCSQPYDFEMANAQLEIELAKINIKNEVIASESPCKITSAHDNSQMTYETQVQTENIKKGSGDGLDEKINEVTGKQLNPENSINLKKGEYYSHKKCFFDQISCPENSVNLLSNKQNLNNFSDAKLNEIELNTKKEKKSNWQTFGLLIAKTPFVSRRKSNRNFSEMLISTSA